MKTKVCLICTLIVVSIFVTTIMLSPIHSDNSPRGDGGNMEGSLDANVHEGISRRFAGDPVELHIHAIAYAHSDHHQFGDYSISYKFELSEQGEKMRKAKNNQKIEGIDTRANFFDDGCSEELNFKDDFPWAGNAWAWDHDYLKRHIASTVKSYVSVIVTDKNGNPVKDWFGNIMKEKTDKVKAIDNASMINGVLTPKLPDDFNNNEEEEDPEEQGNANPTSPGLYNDHSVGASTITINGEEMVDTAPGDSVYVSLVMPSDRGYSQIYWYLAGPDDSGYGSQIGSPTYSSGTDIVTETSFMFSMPSDASGVYTLTAYIYPHSSASDQTVYEYTLKIYCS